MSLKDFSIVNRLGEGAYSSVYKVKRKSDDQIYALKKVKLMNLSEKEKLNALNEVRILASIRHPNIIGYKEAFLDEASNSLCIVMEYCDNGDLFQKITEFQKKGCLFPEPEIFHIFIQIVKGLQELHNLKIFHRDLKSANVFLCKDGSVKLGDMNVSKVAKKGLLYTQTGTPYYASPEVWKDQPYESKSDIWSLGCVLYEMTTLKPPFRAEDMEALYKKVIRGQYPRIPPHFSVDLSNVLRALLQVTPHLRPSCDKILSLQAIQRHLHENSFVEVEDDVNNALMQTIKIPKNLHYLTDRLPKPNYAPLKVKKMEKQKFVQTMAGYPQRNQNSQSVQSQHHNNDNSSESAPKLLLPKISHQKQSKNYRQKSNQNNNSILGGNSIISEVKADYKSHSVDRNQDITPLILKNQQQQKIKRYQQQQQQQQQQNYGQNGINSQHSRGNSKHLRALQNDESVISGQPYQKENNHQPMVRKNQHKQVLNNANRRDKSRDNDSELLSILDIHSMNTKQLPREKENIIQSNKKIHRKHISQNNSLLEIDEQNEKLYHNNNNNNVKKYQQGNNNNNNSKINSKQVLNDESIDNGYARQGNNHNSNNNKQPNKGYYSNKYERNIGINSPEQRYKQQQQRLASLENGNNYEYGGNKLPSINSNKNILQPQNKNSYLPSINGNGNNTNQNQKNIDEIKHIYRNNSQNKQKNIKQQNQNQNRKQNSIHNNNNNNRDLVSAENLERIEQYSNNNNAINSNHRVGSKNGLNNNNSPTRVVLDSNSNNNMPISKKIL